MITVKLNGGLGNQLFQYATGRALSLKWGVPLRLDTSNYLYYNVHPLRIQNMNHNCEIYSHAGRVYKAINSVKFQRLLSMFGLRSDLYIEDSIEFDPAVLSLGPGATIYGYFQSEKYFSSIRERLLEEISVKDASLLPIRQQIHDIKSCNNSISVHVRRGDYVTNASANDVHGLCKLNYFSSAVEFVLKSSKEKSAKIYVFSDDIEWCKSNLKLDYECIYISGQENAPELDMHLMSLCKYNIISNSTFSWWAAWLNRNEEKVVVAPDKWFQSKTLSSEDLVPGNWARL